MSIPQTPSTLTVPLMRHKSYFIHEADVTIRVDRVYIVPSTRVDHPMSCTGRKLLIPSPSILPTTGVRLFQAATGSIDETWPGPPRVFRSQSTRLGRSYSGSFCLLFVGFL